MASSMDLDRRSKPIDLDPGSRIALEVDALLEWVASYARTVPGAARVRGARARSGAAELREALELLDEGRRLHDRDGSWVGGGLADPEAALRALEPEGRGLALEALVALAATLRAAGDLRARFSALDPADFPGLRSLGSALPDLRAEARAVLDGVEPDGRISDRASAELRAVRRGRERAAAHLERTLRSLLRGPDAQAVIRDDFITQRNGRYVIPVRTDAPRVVRGIVHASSSSGATQFVEPLETVELNNRLVELAEREREEEQRILLRWSDAFRARLDGVEQAVDGLTRLDELQARVRFGAEIDGVTPVLNPDGPLSFRAIRHPLLDRHLREKEQRCTPLDLTLDPADGVLVLSGPNAGGKTVALKTFGLAVVMAQTGLPVPAERCELPPFRQLRADIGDHQSIHADLSTYSAHIRSVIEFLGGADPPALFLFDEIGTGTDPSEGAALSQAVLEALQRPGITTLATTHQGALKSWAFVDEHASSAAMEFDVATLRPTFRILMDAAGASAGLDVAEQLGLSSAIVERAREHLGEPGRRGESYMNRLRELTAEAETRREELALRERELAGRADELAARIAEFDERRRGEADRRLEEALAALRREARRGLDAIADRRERRRAEREVAQLEGRLAGEKARYAAELCSPGASGEWIEPDALEPGCEVRVLSLRREGRVERVRGDRVDVRMGRMVFTVRRADLRVRSGSPPSAGAPADAPVRTGGGFRPLARECPEELMLIGKRVEEALEELDRFLDAAVLGGRREVRIVHGHGTGRLRKAVRAHLSGHALVRRRRAGEAHEGGDGATVAELR